MPIKREKGRNGDKKWKTWQQKISGKGCFDKMRKTSTFTNNFLVAFFKQDRMY